MKEYLESKIKGKRVLILGMGAEGKSTFRHLRNLFPEQIFTLADRRDDLSSDPELKHPSNRFQSGSGYLNDLHSFDLIIKSPGISFKNIPESVPLERFTSQTAMFLEVFRNRIIGITGTKGKSTTASLTHHLLKAAGNDVLLIGNIGIPAFDVLDQINDDTLIVFELSAHQLEGIRVSPHIAVLLNIYQEHLDHYAGFRAYQMAKYNIARWQKTDDHFIFHSDDLLIRSLMDELPLISISEPYSITAQSDARVFVSDGKVFSHTAGLIEKICDLNGLSFLPGKHNLLNLLAAISVCRAVGVDIRNLCGSLESFTGLQHRMEFVGEFDGIRFYNDSIATIPEAVIFALETIGDVDTLILGGYDRGIDYSALIEYLGQSKARNLFFTGNAGKRLKKELESTFTRRHNLMWFDNFDEMITTAITSTVKGKSCLLSPAAASYDQFMNFEHRGNRFKEIIRNWFAEQR